jgi:UrcA family protein
MKLMKTLMIAGALVVSAQVAQAGDVAKDSRGRLITTVSYDDLDLNRAAGVNALYNRLWVATKKVCVEPAVGDLKGKRTFIDCRSQAMSEAVADVHNSNLDEAYVAHTGKQVPAMSVASIE